MATNLVDLVLSKATTDAEFRGRLFADPRATLLAEGVEIPDDVEVVVVESGLDKLMLPLFPFVGDKISTEELDAVAGGRIQINYAVPSQEVSEDD